MHTRSILLEGLRYFATHGVHPEEARCGRWFQLDIRLDLPPRSAQAGDQLADTLDYAAIHACCTRVMSHRVQLLETLAETLITELARLTPDVQAVRVCVSKENPPFQGICGRVAVDITQTFDKL